MLTSRCLFFGPRWYSTILICSYFCRPCLLPNAEWHTAGYYGGHKLPDLWAIVSAVLVPTTLIEVLSVQGHSILQQPVGPEERVLLTNNNIVGVDVDRGEGMFSVVTFAGGILLHALYRRASWGRVVIVPLFRRAPAAIQKTAKLCFVSLFF